MRWSGGVKRCALGVLLATLLLRADVGTATITLYSPVPARNDRFYVGTPENPKQFVGDPYDWSGIGRSNHWATMISPSYFVSATHYTPSGNLSFYATNVATGPEVHSIQSAVQVFAEYSGHILPTDLWLGKLATPVSSAIATYPIYAPRTRGRTASTTASSFTRSAYRPARRTRRACAWGAI